jgi:hypothetical protein
MVSSSSNNHYSDDNEEAEANVKTENADEILSS